MVIDPGDAGAVRAALDAVVREELGDGVRVDGDITPAGAGMSTFIWYFGVAGSEVPAGWDGPLVLRIHPPGSAPDNALDEAAIQKFVAAHGYPAPAPLLVSPHHTTHDHFGLPAMVMPKVPGETMATAVVHRPLQMDQLLRDMAARHLQLHAIPLDGCPLPTTPALVDRQLVRWQRMVDDPGHVRPAPWPARLRDGLAWLERYAAHVREEVPVLGHNDFHPLNILVDPDPANPEPMMIIDWTDAEVGDRHFDVGRTIALFWVASIAAEAPLERVALRLLRGHLARTYRRAYETGYVLDEQRLRYWQAGHLFRGVMQVLDLFHGTDAPDASNGGGASRTVAADAVPEQLAETLHRRFLHVANAFERGP